VCELLAAETGENPGIPVEPKVISVLDYSKNSATLIS
jgi:hypothetical protein